MITPDTPLTYNVGRLLVIFTAARDHKQAQIDKALKDGMGAWAAGWPGGNVRIEQQAIQFLKHRIKAGISQINADMRKRTIERVEKNQIAGLKFSRRQRLRGFTDGTAVARQDNAGGLPEHMADEPAAIEPGFRRNATQTVGIVDQTDGVEGNGLGRRVRVCGGRQQQASQQQDSLHRSGICSIVETRLQPIVAGLNQRMTP